MMLVRIARTRIARSKLIVLVLPSQKLKELSHLSSSEIRGSVFYGAISGVAIIGQAWILAFIINGIGFESRSIDWSYPYLYLFLGFLIIRSFTIYLVQRQAFQAGERVKYALQEESYQNIWKASPIYLNKIGSGALSTALLDATETIRGYYQLYLPARRLSVIIPVLIWVPVLFYDWVSALIMLFTAPFIPLFMILIGHKAERKNQELWQSMNRLSNSFLDTIQGLPTLAIFDTAKTQRTVIKDSSENYRLSTMSVLKLAFLSSVTLEFFATVSIALIAVLIGFRLFWGEMNFFNGFFILLLAPEFYLPLRKMGVAYHARMESEAAIEKIIEIEAAPRHIAPTSQKNVPDKIDSLEFDDVVYTYPEKDSPAISNVSFQASSREHIAFMGPSGAGKSTIFSLLMGFITPSCGQVRINGVDVREFSIESLRSKISWVPQSPILFHGTIMDNLCMGCTREISREEIQDVCIKFCIHDEIKSLPQGYESKVFDKGVGLSGGQIQRLALARAVLRDTPIILLDEPTASLDRETEVAILEQINCLKASGKIIIGITHHTVARGADIKIIHLENGRQKNA